MICCQGFRLLLVLALIGMPPSDQWFPAWRGFTPCNEKERRVLGICMHNNGEPKFHFQVMITWTSNAMVNTKKSTVDLDLPLSRILGQGTDLPLSTPYIPQKTEFG